MHVVLESRDWLSTSIWDSKAIWWAANHSLCENENQWQWIKLFTSIQIISWAASSFIWLCLLACRHSIYLISLSRANCWLISCSVLAPCVVMMLKYRPTIFTDSTWCYTWASHTALRWITSSIDHCAITPAFNPVTVCSTSTWWIPTVDFQDLINIEGWDNITNIIVITAKLHALYFFITLFHSIG